MCRCAVVQFGEGVAVAVVVAPESRKRGLRFFFLASSTVSKNGADARAGHSHGLFVRKCACPGTAALSCMGRKPGGVGEG